MISRLPADVVGYPLYELTASGLNSAYNRKEVPNRYRVANSFFSNDNFALLRLSGEETSHAISLQIRDVQGNIVQRVDVPLEQLGYSIHKPRPHTITVTSNGPLNP